MGKETETAFSMWRGNLPCVCGPCEGCLAHNPDRVSIAYNRRLPSDKKKPGFAKLFLRPREPIGDTDVAEQESEPIWSTLYMDHSTVDPLTPVHESIPYALAWYHINWVQAADPGSSVMSRVNALACIGTGTGRPDLKFTIEPFYYNKTFLLDQSIQFRLQMERRSSVWEYQSRQMRLFQGKKWHFQICPHTTHQFLRYVFEETKGLIQARVLYRTSRSNRHTFTTWKSVYGPKWLFWGCPKCSTDSDIKIELVKDEVVVSIRLYKNLGPGSSPFDKNWLAALRRGGSMERTPTEIKKRPVVETVRKAIEAKKSATLNRNT